MESHVGSLTILQDSGHQKALCRDLRLVRWLHDYNPWESQPVSIARGNKLNEQLNQLTNKNCWLLPGKALDRKVKLIVQCDFHASVTNGSPRMHQPSKPLPFFMEEFLAHSSTASGGPKLQELQRRALKSRSWDICHSEYRLSNAEKFGFVGSDEFHGNCLCSLGLCFRVAWDYKGSSMPRAIRKLKWTHHCV